MKFDEFKRARKLILENKTIDIDSLNEYMSSKYDERDHLNESFMSSVTNWIKRNFSAKAKQLKSLSNEYYEWLMNEYGATYKNRREETALEEFYRKEKVSDDIESKMKTVSDKELYQKLANELILDSRLRAKKDFAIRLLGTTSRLVNTYDEKYKTQQNKVDTLFDEMSSEERISFGENIKALADYIHEKSSWATPQQLERLATGVIKYAQIRKNVNYIAYDIVKLKKMYDNGEFAFFGSSNNAKLKHDKGVALIYSIRSIENDKTLLSKNDLTAKDIENQISAIYSQVHESGIEANDADYWGLFELFLRKTTVEGREKVLDLLKALSTHPINDLKILSRDIEKILTDDSLSAVDEAQSHIEKYLSGANSTEQEPEEPEVPDAETLEVPTKDAIDRLKELLLHTKYHILEKTAKDAILTVATARPNSNGKLIMSIKNSTTKQRGGYDPSNKGLDQMFVDNAKFYTASIDDNTHIVKFNEEKIKQCVNFLITDIENIAKRDNENYQICMSMSDSSLALFIIRLLRDKQLADKAIAEADIEKVFAQTFEQTDLK